MINVVAKVVKMIITNKADLTLNSVFKKSFEKTKSFDLLVGYFYFSGFHAIKHEGIDSIPMRILVGLRAETTVSNLISEIEDIYLGKSFDSRKQIKNDYYSNLCSIINSTDYYDSEEKADSLRLFCKKIKDGSLEIRKTIEPNHAKMYIMTYKDNVTSNGVTPGMVVVGSSNLSLEGLKNRFEVNAILNDSSDYKNAIEVFNELWDDAVDVASKDSFEDFDNNVLKKIWLDNIYSPYLVYLKVLDEYFSLEISNSIRTAEEINDAYKNLRYQTDAVKMGINSIQKHNGVIIADVVGLGKSIIASVIANNLGLTTYIISPPHLKDQWEDYLILFKISGKVFSSGKIEDALESYNKNSNNKECLVIVDEAHRYRNEETKDYFLLHSLCMGNKVILLTATPFNNAPSDIYAIIKLFQIPNHSTLKTVANLGDEFKSLIFRYRQINDGMKKNTVTESELKVEIEKISKKIRAIIEPLVVRRSRLDLEKIQVYKQDLEKQGIAFPEVEDPEIKTYDLDFINDNYLHTLELISPSDKGKTQKYYKAAKYKSLSYIKDDKRIEVIKYLGIDQKDYEMIIGRQNSLSDLMKRLLVRRFESSVNAFLKTLESLIIKSNEILKWVTKTGKVPMFKGDLPEVEDDYFEENIEILKDKGFKEIPIEYLEDQFVKDIGEDIELLQEIKTLWFKKKNDLTYDDMEKTDPKLKSFIDLVKDQIKRDSNRKIIVFSEFGDTVDYISAQMKKKGLRVFKYTSSDANKTNKEIIKRNFDAGFERKMQQNEYDILIATDAIAEGYSLHRAGTIFNYDIPYNPTRVIQRVGRINRINKKVFDKLYIYNFFPSIVGESTTNTKKISTLKMSMIQSIMGEDTKILTNQEALSSYFVERFKKEQALFESESGESVHRNIWESELHSESMIRARNIPLRARIQRKNGEKEGVVVFGKRDEDYVFRFSSDAEQESILLSPSDAFDLFFAKVDEKSYHTSERFNLLYDSLKKDLFQRKTDTDKRDRKKAIDILQLYLSKHKSNNGYYKDLLTIISDYDALPKYEVRLIGQKSLKELDSLMNDITPTYLERISNAVKKTSTSKNSIILAEEIVK